MIKRFLGGVFDDLPISRVTWNKVHRGRYNTDYVADYYAFGDGVLLIAGICVNKLYVSTMCGQSCNQICASQCEYVSMNFAT